MNYNILRQCVVPVAGRACCGEFEAPHKVLLKETPLVRVLVILCTLIEEWWTQNKWKVQTTHTSTRSVSPVLPQVFPPILNTYAQDHKRTITSGVLSVNPLGLITELQREHKLMDTERPRTIY